MNRRLFRTVTFIVTGAVAARSLADDHQHPGLPHLDPPVERPVHGPPRVLYATPPNGTVSMH